MYSLQNENLSGNEVFEYFVELIDLKFKEIENLNILKNGYQNRPFVEIWKTLLFYHCKKKEIFEVLAYKTFKNLPNLEINFDSSELVDYIRIKSNSVIISLSLYSNCVETVKDLNVEISIDIEKSVAKYIDAVYESLLLNKDKEKISENEKFLREYIFLLKNRGSIIKKLRCRYSDMSDIHRFYIYFTKGFWRDIKLHHNLEYYENALNDIIEPKEKKITFVPSIDLLEEYDNYIKWVKPIIDKEFQEIYGCSVKYNSIFKKWRVIMDEE